MILESNKFIAVGLIIIVFFELNFLYRTMKYQKMPLYKLEKDILFFAEFSNNYKISEMGLSLAGNHIFKTGEISGRRAVKLSIDRNKNRVPYRSELVPFKLPEQYFTKSNKAKYGYEYLYSINIFLPKDWKFSKAGITILQWHEYADFDLGETWRNPPLKLEIDSGSSGIGRNYFVWHRGDSKKITGTNGPYEVSECIEVGNIKDDLGKWTNWLFKVKWSFEDNGYLFVYKNGKEIISRNNIKNTYFDKHGPYWKFGLYIPAWKNSALPKGQSYHYTAYFDSVLIRIGK